MDDADRFRSLYQQEVPPPPRCERRARHALARTDDRCTNVAEWKVIHVASGDEAMVCTACVPSPVHYRSMGLRVVRL